MPYIIEMESKEFGTDTFEYDTKTQMQVALLQLVDNALEWYKEDGMARSFVAAEVD